MAPLAVVLVLLINKSVQRGVTSTEAVLLAAPPGAGLVKPAWTEVPSANPLGVVTVEVLVTAEHTVRVAKVALTV